MCVKAQHFVGVVRKETLDFLGHVLPGRSMVDRGVVDFRPSDRTLLQESAELLSACDASRLQIPLVSAKKNLNILEASTASTHKA